MMVSNSMLPKLLEKQFRYIPEPQPFYTFLNDAWHRCNPTPAPASESSASHLQSLHIITWNIDFMTSHPRARMASALAYLEGLVASIPASAAVAIFLQEMMEPIGPHQHVQYAANDFTLLRDAPWVRSRFHMTDIDTSTSYGAYGQVTLIDRRLHIAQVSRLRFVSEYQRDALLVDIPLASGRRKILRLCNVHLDSMYGSLRPVQWKAVAKYLQNGEDGVAASILAGDCNASLPRDKTEPQDNGFKDAYLELGGKEGDEAGATWGFQSVHWERFGRQRLDKVVFWGSMEAKRLERIGMGVKVEDERIVKELEGNGELAFVTDHYGLLCELIVGCGP